MTRLRFAFLIVATILTFLTGEESSQAALITLPPQTVSKTYSDGQDFSDLSSLTFRQFDPSLGALYSVQMQLSGEITRGLLLENLTGSAKQIQTTVSTTLTVNGLDNTPVLSLSRSASVSDNLSAYDGQINFSGTSGKTHDNLLSASDSVNSFFDTNSPEKLALFTGLGTLALPFFAKTPSSSDGGGQAFTLNGAATVQLIVTYTYSTLDPPPPLTVPEPSSLALLGIGGGSAISLRFLRRRPRRLAA